MCIALHEDYYYVILYRIKVHYKDVLMINIANKLGVIIPYLLYDFKHLYQRDERVQVILLHASKMEVDQLKEMINGKMKHTYLKEYIQDPFIDEDKLTILTLIVNFSKRVASNKENIIVSAMLLQMALDTHELIPPKKALNESEQSKTANQLTVLAGDFYSGLYYFLLSESSEIDTIRITASAIKEINEYKMKLYYKEFQNYDEYITMIQKIESLILVKVAEHFQLAFLTKVIENIILVKTLINEMEKLRVNHTSIVIEQSISHPTVTSLKLTIDNINKSIKSDILQLPKDEVKLQKELNDLVDQSIFRCRTIMEEG